MRVLFVRHGETTWNVEERVQGWAGAPLSGRGREQARATGEFLADEGVERLVVSDLQRAQETARLFEEGGLDVEHSFEQAWRERDFGDYQGLDVDAIVDRHDQLDPDVSLTGVEDIPGGESLDDFVQRVLSGWDSLVAGLGADETVAVVTHGGPIRVVIAEVTGSDMPTLAREWSPNNCGVTEVDVEEGVVIDRDVCSHLDD